MSSTPDAVTPELTRHELDDITASLTARYEGRYTRDQIEAVVLSTYQGIAAGASITTHLIPLTVNRVRAALDPA